MNSLFSPIIKKARRFQRVVLFWCSIGASISIICMAWLILQYLGSLVGPSISTLIKQILMSIWVIFLVMLGSFIPDDENKRINRIVMSVLSFFTATVIFSGIRVMIFPISIICLLCSFYLALFYLEDDNDDFPIKVLRLMDRSKRSDYSTRLGFRVQLCCPHLASLAILCLLANPRLFEGCVILGAINITFIVHC